jgi:hypothetical protein
MYNSYISAITELKAVTDRLNEVEASILPGPREEMLHRWRTSGGEQYRPDPNKIKCMDVQ